MKTDQELQKKFRLSIINDNLIDIVFLEEELDPEDSIRLARLVGEAVLKILNENLQKQYDGLIDLTALGNKVSYLASETRKTYAEIMSHPQIVNIAFVGSNTFFRAAINFMIQIAGKEENTKWFSSKEEAISWLKSRKI